MARTKETSPRRHRRRTRKANSTGQPEPAYQYGQSNSKESAVDKNGRPLTAGSRIKYFVYKNDAAKARHKASSSRKGTVLANFTLGKMLDVVLDGDPFPLYVEYNRVQRISGSDPDNPLIGHRHRGRPAHNDTGMSGERATKMPTATRSTTRELRKEAKELGIEGWEEMTVTQLRKAVADAGGDTKPPRKTASAKKTTAKKAPAKKASTKSKAKAKESNDEVAENGNPFKPGTNLFEFCEELIKGGKRSAMVKRLKRKIDLKPRKESDDYDEDYEIDRRLLITGQILRRDHGFEIEREGRGPDATIVATPPE